MPGKVAEENEDPNRIDELFVVMDALSSAFNEPDRICRRRPARLLVPEGPDPSSNGECGAGGSVAVVDAAHGSVDDDPLDMPYRRRGGAISISGNSESSSKSGITNCASSSIPCKLARLRSLAATKASSHTPRSAPVGCVVAHGQRND